MDRVYAAGVSIGEVDAKNRDELMHCHGTETSPTSPIPVRRPNNARIRDIDRRLFDNDFAAGLRATPNDALDRGAWGTGGEVV